jgi:hypothetical protein
VRLCRYPNAIEEEKKYYSLIICQIENSEELNFIVRNEMAESEHRHSLPVLVPEGTAPCL